MTVSLVLLRHAKSSWDDPALADHDRPLAPRGMKDARRIGDALAERRLTFDEVLCSSALRARETFRLVARQAAKVPEPRVLRALYLPDLAAFRAALATARDTTRSLLVVGHSPVIDAFVLSHGSQLEKHVGLVDGIPTGSFVVMRFAVTRFSELAEGNVHGPVSAFVTPRSLAATAEAALAPPTKGERIEIDRHTSVRELACLAFESAVSQLRGNASGARAAIDPEYGHHQRVAARKLRLYLKLFRRLVGKERARRLADELRWVFARLGAVREHDVLAAMKEGQRIFAGTSDALRALAKALEASRAAHHAALVEALESPRYRHLVRDLVALTAELDQDGKGQKLSAQDFVAMHVERRIARVKKREKKLAPDDLQGRHALRKALKKLRYTAELGRGAFRNKPLKAFLSRLNALQDELGAQNDARVARELIATALDALPAKDRAALRIELAQDPPKPGPLPALALALKAFD